MGISNHSGITIGADGLPTGGTAGQVLTKVSSTDYDAEWQTGGGGGGHTIQDEGTPLTARTNLNFVGATVTVTDDAINDATVVTIVGDGTGDVVGPASATDNAIARFDGTTGKLIQNSTVTISDSGNILATRYSSGSDDVMTVNGTLTNSNFAAHSDSAAIYESHTHTNSAGSGSIYYMARSRGTEGAETVVQNGDVLGGITFVGFDGTDYSTSAAIVATVDGAPGNNDMPGKIRFYTSPDGTETLTERMSIAANGLVTVTDSFTAVGTVTGSNLSGTNTGDQTSIVGITGTKAQFDAACSDGNFVYTGDNVSSLANDANYIDGTGTATYVPFFSDSNTLTSDSHFYYNSTTDVLHVHGLAGDATDGLLIESESGTDIAIMGAANTANVTWYGNHNFNTATADTIASFGASKTLTSLSTATYPSLTELSYVKGVTSAIQTQLGNKQPLDATLTSIAAVSGVQGDLLYASGADTWIRLAKDTNATRYLSNTGASNNPAWAQIDLSNGVTGTLPAASVGAGFVKVDGTTPLTADWDAGSFEIRAQTFESDVATGTAPLVIASTTLVPNLNADLLDGKNTGTSGNVIPLLDGANTWSANQTLSGTNKLLLGAIGSLYTDGSYLIINPIESGTNPIVIGAQVAGGGTGDLVCNRMGFFGSTVSTTAVMNYNGTGAFRQFISSLLTYNGAGNSAASFQNQLIDQGTNANFTVLGYNNTYTLNTTSHTTLTHTGHAADMGINAATVIASGTYTFYGYRVRASVNGVGSASTSGGTFRRYGFFQDAITAIAGSPGSDLIMGAFFNNSINLVVNNPIIFDSTSTALGDSTIKYNSGSTRMELDVDGTDAIYYTTTAIQALLPVDIQNSLQCDSIVNDTGLAHGTYTPTLTNVANVAASTAYQCQYMRVGNTVTVSGKVDADPTAAGATQLGISLPIASNIGAQEDCAGTAASSAVAGLCAAILGDAANNRAEMSWVAVDVANRSFYFQFMYEVI